MPRNSTTATAEKRPAGGKLSALRKPAARRKPAVVKPARPAVTVKPARPKKPAPAKSPDYIDLDDEPGEELELDDAGQSAPGSLEARKRIEILRVERLLQQALSDTFDF